MRLLLDSKTKMQIREIFRKNYIKLTPKEYYLVGAAIYQMLFNYYKYNNDSRLEPVCCVLDNDYKYLIRVIGLILDYFGFYIADIDNSTPEQYTIEYNKKESRIWDLKMELS